MSPACQKSLNKPVSGMQALCRAPLSSACSGNGGAAKIVPHHPHTPLNAIENSRWVQPSRALRRFFDSLQHFRQNAPYFTSLFVRRRGAPPLPSSSAFAGIFQISGRKNRPTHRTRRRVRLDVRECLGLLESSGDGSLAGRSAVFVCRRNFHKNGLREGISSVIIKQNMP